MPLINVQTAESAVLSRLLEREIDDLHEMRGGRNSRVYRLAAGRDRYIAKFYFRHPADARNRFQTETSSLRYLWDCGVRAIPRLIAADEAEDCAVYEHVDGTPLAPSGGSEDAVDEAVAFLALLKDISRDPRSRSLPAASEACFSAQAVVDNIGGRLRRLMETDGSQGGSLALRRYLQDQFTPALERISAWSRSRFSAADISWSKEIPLDERTLSPSDFGFHNAVRDAEGRITFLDFEYFGWDDPAKTVSDFLLHPGMDLNDSAKRRFTRSMLRRFQGSLGARLQSLYPLWGLKWCLILLNEFVPEHQSRRRFSKASAYDPGILERQLDLAGRMLQKILSEFERFPYDD